MFQTYSIKLISSFFKSINSVKQNNQIYNQKDFGYILAAVLPPRPVEFRSPKTRAVLRRLIPQGHIG
jgi:hypothetical protein